MSEIGLIVVLFWVFIIGSASFIGFCVWALMPERPAKPVMLGTPKARVADLTPPKNVIRNLRYPTING